MVKLLLQCEGQVCLSRCPEQLLHQRGLQLHPGGGGGHPDGAVQHPAVAVDRRARKGRADEEPGLHQGRPDAAASFRKRPPFRIRAEKFGFFFGRFRKQPVLLYGGLANGPLRRGQSKNYIFVPWLKLFFKPVFAASSTSMALFLPLSQ